MERVDEQLMRQVNAQRQSNAGLMKEGFKAQTIFEMMNNCADRCQLVYHESGIKDASQPGVDCYKNCVTKAYKLASRGLQ